MGATQEGGGGTFGLPELEPQEEGVKQRYYHPTPLNAWMKPCVPTAVRCFTCKRSTISLCRAIRTCLPTPAAAQAGQTLLYRVTDAGYEPVTMQMSKEAAQ